MDAGTAALIVFGVPVVLLLVVLWFCWFFINPVASGMVDGIWNRRMSEGKYTGVRKWVYEWQFKRHNRNRRR